MAYSLKKAKKIISLNYLNNYLPSAKVMMVPFKQPFQYNSPFVFLLSFLWQL